MVSCVSQGAAQVSRALPVTCSDGEDPGKSTSISTPTKHSRETPSSFPRQIKKNSITVPQLLAADGVQENTCRKVKLNLKNRSFFKPQENHSAGLDVCLIFKYRNLGYGAFVHQNCFYQ